MPKNSWEEVLESLYSMGGYGIIPIAEPEGEIPPSADLSVQSDLHPREVESVVEKLEKSGLVARPDHIREPTGEIGPPVGVKLTETGFTLANDKINESQNREMNRSIAFLTLILAAVGVAQATALSILSEAIAPLAITFLVGIGLLAVYIRMVQTGIIFIK